MSITVRSIANGNGSPAVENTSRVVQIILHRETPEAKAVVALSYSIPISGHTPTEGTRLFYVSIRVVEDCE